MTGKQGPRIPASEDFAEFYTTSFKAVFRATYAMCGDRGVAEDAAQEAFARALERWPRLAKTQPSGWVVTTAMNAARRALRHRPYEQSDRAFELSDRLVLDSESTDGVDLWKAVRELSQKQQEAVVLRYVADFSLADIASIMGCGEGSVKTHLSRARQHLRNDVRGEDYGSR